MQQNLDGENMQIVGIIVNISKDIDLKVTNSIARWIEAMNGQVMLTEEASSRLRSFGAGYSREEIYIRADLIIVLGGDGTILGVSREAAKYNKPLLGVNLGHLGFLAEVEVKDIFKSLESVFNGETEIEKRVMLKASICGKKGTKDFYALNDIIITRGMLSRVVTLRTYIDGEFVSAVSGDGLIVATPTGSTAYSLSAGGPIIPPDLPVLVMTPICPHSLLSRSVVFSDTSALKVDLTENHGDAFLSIDGQEGYRICEDEYVIIEKAPFTTNLIKLPGKSFYEVLRTKLSDCKN